MAWISKTDDDYKDVRGVIAAYIMNGLVSRSGPSTTAAVIVTSAVAITDALIAELNKDETRNQDT